MIYIEAPNAIPERVNNLPFVFLAGGITGCCDWQADVVTALKHENCVLLNPRRDDFDVNDPNASEKQIRWEYHMLSEADVIAFWFSSETVQPITLFEYGKWFALGEKTLIVGIHPNYPRRFDVELQTTLHEPQTFTYNLDEHIQNIRNFVKGFTPLTQLQFRKRFCRGGE